MAAFALSRLKFRFRGTIGIILLLGIMIPAGVVVLPLFLVMSKIGLVSNMVSVIIIEVGLFIPVAMFILRNFMSNIPYSITDAALIEGCNDWQSYYWIVLPLAKPAMIAIGLFVFLWSWNEYFLPLIFLRKIELQTVQLAPQYYIGYYSVDTPLYFASMVIVILPVILVYFIFQNKLIEGLTVGALKE